MADQVLLESQIQAINRFPDQNPHPVMRVSDDAGILTYANISSAPVRHSLGIEVGAEVPANWLARLRAAAAMGQGKRVEIACEHRTFALLPVAVPELGFINVYGTDITAEKAVARFPDQNPNPVLRMNHDGELIYANDASWRIVESLGLVIGELLPERLREEVRGRLDREESGPIEITTVDEVYELKPVLVREFSFVNLYGTDVTAAREVARAKEESERLLLNILPPAIASRLRAGERLIADRFDDATLLIADIVGFTRMSSELSADELVALLNDIFGELDVLVDRHGLEKVKTMGDAYMVIGGVPIATTDHAERVAEFALDLISALDALQAGVTRPVSCRVGINCGPVVAGVIGTKRTIYDVWGDTVNLTSRMESMGVAGRIHVSSQVYERLEGRYLFDERGVIDVKGIGPLPTYFLTGRA